MNLPPELQLPVTIAAATAALCWLLSLVFREYSWVDRIWSVVPPVYIGTFAAQAGWKDPRLDLMLVLVTLWGLRLTFNYARKGGYAPGGEDYRWAILKARMRPWQWQIFNLGFIATYQNLLLLLITLPAWSVMKNPRRFGVAEMVLAWLFVLLLALETWADQQQWRFHREKQRRRVAGEPEPKGFCDTGLWSVSRHPNFFCEQGQWWVVYGFAVIATGRLIDVTIVGPLLLTLLFHGSARFTESISAAKYAGYADYQRRVSRMIPFWPKGDADE